MIWGENAHQLPKEVIKQLHLRKRWAFPNLLGKGDANVSQT